MDTNASSSASDQGDSRRRFVKKAAYMAPALMTLPTMLSAAQVGSGPGVCVFPRGPNGEILGEGTVVGGPFDGDVCS
jgi:hypothetical protein